MLYSLWVGRNSGRIRRHHFLYAPLQLAARTIDLDQLFDTLEHELCLFIAEHSKEHIFVSAGVVGWKGTSILLPGRPTSGNSRLVAALVRAGATYFSDEYAVLDEQGRVHPFSRRQSLTETGAARNRVWTEPSIVNRVVLTNYRRGTRWQPRPLTPGQAIMELLPHTLSAAARPADAIAALERVALSSVALKGAHGDPEETAAMLLDAM
jgi:hypothetical protein